MGPTGAAVTAPGVTRAVVTALLALTVVVGCGGSEDSGDAASGDATQTTAVTAPPRNGTAGPSTTEAATALPTTAPTTTAPITTAPTTTTVPSTPATGVLRTPTGVLVPLRAQRLDGSGWVVGTPCGGEAVVATGTPVTGVRVVIDPGHGGPESGAIGPNSLWESELNLDVARRVEQILRAKGVSVELTRRTDVQVTPAARAELAVAMAPELMVSVHHNGGHLGGSPVPGTLVVHQADSAPSRRLAGLLHQRISTALTPLELPWAAGPAPGALAVRNVEGTDYYGVLRRSAGVPAVIVESLYLSNPAEAAALERDEVRQLEAEAIAAGILDHLTTTEPGSGFRPAMTLGVGGVPSAEPTGCTDPPLG